MKLSFALTGYLIVLLRLTAGAETDALVLFPDDPSCREGNNITLWCTLSKNVLETYSADDLEITAKKYLDQRPYAAPETPDEIKLVESFEKTKVNATTIRLFAHNVSSALDYHVIICHTKNWTLYVMQLIQVGVPPPPITITDHYVRNWKSFVFKWNIPNHLQVRTTYTSWYMLHPNDTSYVYCGECKSVWNKTASCNRCEITKLGLSRGITLNVTAVNRYGSESSSLSIHNLYSYNIPGQPNVSRVSNETIDNNGMYATTIYSRPSRRRVAVHHNTAIRCDSWNYETSSFQSAENDSVLQFVALPAYSDCQISVRCRSVDDEGNLSKYFGKETVLTFRTGEGVPRRSVETCSNCFHIEKLDGSSTSQALGRKRFVVLYFKSLTEEDARGKVTKYRVKYWKEKNASREVLTSLIVDVSSVTTVELYMEADDSYVVTIEASTKHGFNDKLVPTKIYIPEQSKVLDPVFNLTALEINSTHVQLSWSASGNDCRYTVFWCHSGEYSSKCQSEIQWVELNHTTSSHTVQVLKDDKRLIADRFGVSMFRYESDQFFTSNIAWTKCIFSLNDLSPPPTVGVITADDLVTLELITSRCPLVKSGYVYAFKVVLSELNGNYSAGHEVDHKYVMFDDLHRNCYHRTGSRPSDNERYGCYELPGLKPFSSYVVSVYSVTLAGVSLTSTSINFTTESVSFLKTNAAIAVLVSVCAVGLVFAGLGLCTLIRCCYKHRFCKIVITMPPTSPASPKSIYYSQGYNDLLPNVMPDNKSLSPGILPQIVDDPPFSDSGSVTSSCSHSSSSSTADPEPVFNDGVLYARVVEQRGSIGFLKYEPVTTPHYNSSMTERSAGTER